MAELWLADACNGCGRLIYAGEERRGSPGLVFCVICQPE